MGRAGLNRPSPPSTAVDNPIWFASVGVLDKGGYEVVRRDPTRNEHEATTSTSINDIARDLPILMAARHYPGRPTSQITDFSNTA